MNFTRYFLLLCLSFSIANAQEKKAYGRLFGGFETNAQHYLEFVNDEKNPEYNRSNNYLQLNYEISKWSFGLQAESYVNKALLNYYPGFKGTNVATYYAKYKSKNFEATAGYFYDQIGSGMILRAWEDRALGINTALRGGRIIFKPADNIKFMAFYGQQRTGFKISNGQLYGIDIEANLSKWFGFKKSELDIGISNVNRFESINKILIPNPEFNPTTSAYSFRVNFSHDIFYSSLEANYKSKDAVLNRISNQVVKDLIKTGNALQFNIGMAQDGLGINLTFRRTENMLFTSQRIPDAVGLNQFSLDYFDKVINFTPALTKQHHSNLTNIYVYQAQAGVEFKSNEIMKAGETGGQIDVVYDFAKKSIIGGKFGTKLAVNFSSWYNLPGSFRSIPPNYETIFFGVGERYFSDFNVEIKKQLSKNTRTSFLYAKQYYNKPWVEDSSSSVNANILYAEITHNFTNSRSIRADVEHMWADADFKNWIAGSFEFNYNEKISIYALDLVNYGNTKDADAPGKHYLTVGSAYRKGTYRFALSYGRQRGGLVCVGGVCRFVPESTGFSLSMNTAF